MNWLAQFNFDLLILFTLILTRVSGLVMTAPIYGSSDVPIQARALLAFSLAVLVTPTQFGTLIEPPGTLPNYLTFIGSELLVGVALGLGVLVLFSGVQVAGQLIGRVSGTALSDVYDPAFGEEVPQFARLLFLLAMAVFVSLGGHRIVMAGLLDTFEAIPPGSRLVPLSLADTFERLLTQSFALGIRASAPVVTALLLATVVLGLISRTLPQLNVLMLGFGLNAILTFGVLALTLGAAAWVFQDQIEPAIEMLVETFVLPSSG
ncbi:MAG: flagellar biosynthetic protein FliR [Thermoguttaceae bacterium]|nr:flagellar biosynthetic protein FliR [Thermoguttaceae bacterium]